MAQPTQEKVEFTARQLEYLDRMYPEQLATPEVSIDAVRYHAGQRSVILQIRAKLQR